jgi:gamma-glutamyltranspeptidase / glutathione hydrolase
MTARVALVALIALFACTPSRPPQEQPTATAPSSAASVAPAASASASTVVKARAVPKGVASPPGVALGAHGAVASQDRYATDAGLAILKRGGNAVDAAIAVAFALAVTHPAAGNLGGGGFMVVRMANGATTAIDYRERAPSGASRDMYLDAKGNPTKDSVRGPRAAGIPGTVAGLALAHAKLGTLPWKDLVAPAIALAKDGHQLDAQEAADLVAAREFMKNAGFPKSAAHYEKADGSAFASGDTWRQADLAATLEAVAADPRAFYEGPVAERLANEVSKAGGIWKREDLAAYRAVEREPMRFVFRGHDIVTMPLPSSGGIVLLQILRGAELLEVAKFPWQSADDVHRYVEIARRAFADRNALLGDPDFVHPPVAELTSDAYIQKRMATIDGARATPSKDVGPGIAPPAESHQTTHFSVIDERGDAVSNTYTLNDSFGAKFVVPGTGVLLNNEMDDFAVKPGSPNMYGLVQGEPNAIAPGKRMLSSMTPTIVVKDGEVRAVLGTPGGPTIITTVAQLARAILDYHQPLDVAVPAPRIHHQWLPDSIAVERTVPAELVKALEERGHAVKPRGSIGSANCIEVDPETRGFRAVADVTRGGAAAAAY